MHIYDSFCWGIQRLPVEANQTASAKLFTAVWNRSRQAQHVAHLQRGGWGLVLWALILFWGELLQLNSTCTAQDLRVQSWRDCFDLLWQSDRHHCENPFRILMHAWILTWSPGPLGDRCRSDRWHSDPILCLVPAYMSCSHEHTTVIVPLFLDRQATRSPSCTHRTPRKLWGLVGIGVAQRALWTRRALSLEYFGFQKYIVLLLYTYDVIYAYCILYIHI